MIYTWLEFTLLSNTQRQILHNASDQRCFSASLKTIKKFWYQLFQRCFFFSFWCIFLWWSVTMERKYILEQMTIVWHYLICRIKIIISGESLNVVELKYYGHLSEGKKWRITLLLFFVKSPCVLPSRPFPDHWSFHSQPCLPVLFKSNIFVRIILPAETIINERTCYKWSWSIH